MVYSCIYSVQYDNMVSACINQQDIKHEIVLDKTQLFTNSFVWQAEYLLQIILSENYGKLSINRIKRSNFHNQQTRWYFIDHVIIFILYTSPLTEGFPAFLAALPGNQL